MQIIPVIDLRHGQAVQAVAGQREHYQPLSTPLCASAEPVAVVYAYRSLYPFDTFYLADLDAIAKEGDHRSVIAELCTAFPQLNWWLDGGFNQPAELAVWQQCHGHQLRPVIGSESQTDLDRYRQLRAQSPAALLSLDFKQGQFLGPPTLLEQPQLWPQDVILMQLDQVGVDQGPSVTRLESGAYQGCSDRQFFAAGGIRNVMDLKRLKAAAYSGVLVASALHQKRLNTAAVAAVMEN